MKIGIICYPTYGGSGVVATELGKTLARLNHEVHFLAYAMPYRLSEFHENIHYHEVKVMEYPLFEYPPYSLALASKLAEIALYQKLDIVHAHYAIPHAVSAYLAKEMIKDEYSLKIVTTLHGTDITLVGRDPSFLGITRYGISKSDAVTTVSNYLREKTIESFQIEKPIKVIYNFIEEQPEQGSRCEELRHRIAPNGEKIISHLSNFRPVKRIIDIIEMTPKILRKIPVKVMMIGDGPDRSIAETRARDLNIAEHVHFLGKQENIFLLLSSSDVFVMPSSLESFGLASLEAMACGVPCVTSNTGGLTELVKEGISGYTANVGDIDTMANLVISILEDEKKLKSLSASARSYAFENFHVEKIVPQYINLYQKVLST